MSYDTEIAIFGKVSNPEAIWELALAAASESRVNWIDQFDTSDFVKMLEQAASEGRAVTLTKSDTTDLFDNVTSCCQFAGLSYIVKFGERGAEGFDRGFSWRPGMPRQQQFHLDGRNATLKVAHVEKAAQQGIDEVFALIERIKAHTTAGQVEIAPGFADAYRTYAVGEEAPVVSSPAP